MADLSTEELKTEITAILKTADLNVVSAKNVRDQIEKKLKCSLLRRKKEFDQIVMEFVNGQREEEDTEDAAENDNEEVMSKRGADREAKKRPQPTQRKTVTKKKRMSVNDSDSDDANDSDYSVRKKRPIKKKAAAKAGGSGRKSTGRCETLQKC